MARPSSLSLISLSFSIHSSPSIYTSPSLSLSLSLSLSPSLSPTLPLSLLSPSLAMSPPLSIGDPVALYRDLPTLLIGEIVIYCIIFSYTLHAFHTRGRSLSLFLLSLFSAFSFDPLNLINESIWLSPSLLNLNGVPLYIWLLPLYLSSLAYGVSRISLSPFGEASVSALLSFFVFLPLFSCGTKFIWWTYHDTSLSLSLRLLEVPILSLLRTTIYAFSLSLAGRMISLSLSPSDTSSPFLKMLKFFFHLTFSLVSPQLVTHLILSLSHNHPSILHLSLFTILYIVISLLSLSSKPSWTPLAGNAYDTFLNWALQFSSILSALFFALFSPLSHRSIGSHQPFGVCLDEDRNVLPVFGTRVCAERIRGPFNLTCLSRFDGDASSSPSSLSLSLSPSLSHETVDQYTICGTGYNDWVAYLHTVCMFVVCSSYAIQYIFGRFGSAPQFAPVEREREREIEGERENEKEEEKEKKEVKEKPQKRKGKKAKKMD